ncbi:hypothetical protein BT93_F3195 [Corymbia citriodora subsp. variegata]|nr:hypothetical protein BT93_F3195 [Corymbia citriodora subsp. variegata]
MINGEHSPRRLLQPRVGNRCLLFRLFTNGGPIPKWLRSSRETMGFRCPRRVELRKLAMEDRACVGKYLSKCNLEAMTRAVLERKVDLVRPSEMAWFKDICCEYSDDLIK